MSLTQFPNLGDSCSCSSSCSCSCSTCCAFAPQRKPIFLQLICSLGVTAGYPAFSDCDHSAIGYQLSAGHKAALVGGQKNNGLCNLVGFTYASEWDLGRHLGGELFDMFFVA